MKALKAGTVWYLGLAALVVISLPDVVQAQVAKHPSEIPANLRAGTQLMRNALQSLDDSERAHAFAFQAYVQLREAQAKMRNANVVTNFPNPFYNLAIPQVQQAQNRLLETMSHLRYLADGERGPAASASLNEALRMTETILATLF